MPNVFANASKVSISGAFFNHIVGDTNISTGAGDTNIRSHIYYNNEIRNGTYNNTSYHNYDNNLVVNYGNDRNYASHRSEAQNFDYGSRTAQRRLDSLSGINDIENDVSDELLFDFLDNKSGTGSQDSQILSAGEIEGIKKEHDTLIVDIAELKKQLDAEIRVRDAVVNVLNLSRSNNTGIAQETRKLLEAADKSVSSVEERIQELSLRADEAHRKLVDHRTGVLRRYYEPHQPSHQQSQRYLQNDRRNASPNNYSRSRHSNNPFRKNYSPFPPQHPNDTSTENSMATIPDVSLLAIVDVKSDSTPSPYPLLQKSPSSHPGKSTTLPSTFKSNTDRSDSGEGALYRTEQDPSTSRNSAPMADLIIELVSYKEEDDTPFREFDGIRRLLEGVLKDQKRAERILESILAGKDVQLWLDVLQVLAKFPGISTWLRSSILKTMLHLSKKSDLFPQCFIIDHESVEKVEEYPVAEGSFGQLWHGRIEKLELGLKVTKVLSTSNVQQLLKGYMREAIVWQQLEHPNVLPFMGTYYWTESRTQLCLVSPWMEKGNLTDFLKEPSRENIDHYSLVHDVASGLAYLHEKKIVHGDLKGANVMVTPEGTACIGDFGLSRVVDSKVIKFSSATTNVSIGTTGWSAPELLDPPYDSEERPLPCSPSSSTDMYAFAGVCYEIFARKEPFRGFTDAQIIGLVVNRGRRPSRPDDVTLPSDEMWKIMEDCWNREPTQRPAASEVVGRIDGLESVKGFRRPSGWDREGLTLNNVKYPELNAETLLRLQSDLQSFS